MKSLLLFLPMAILSTLLSLKATASILPSSINLIRSESPVLPPFVLKNLNGVERGPADYKGKIILLNFWGTWCSPCIDEMPALEQLWKKFKEKEFVIVAISIDQQRFNKAVRRFIKREGISFPILLDPDGKTGDKYQVSGLPVSFVIGKDGALQGRIDGPRQWDGKEVLAFFEKIIQSGFKN